MKSLARFKREKLFGALEKGGRKVPESWGLEVIFDAFMREKSELQSKYLTFKIKDDPSLRDCLSVMGEIADCSNMLDLLYDIMLEGMRLIYVAQVKMLEE